jgi:hypothetical protein
LVFRGLPQKESHPTLAPQRIQATILEGAGNLRGVEEDKMPFSFSYTYFQNEYFSGSDFFTID